MCRKEGRYTAVQASRSDERIRPRVRKGVNFPQRRAVTRSGVPCSPCMLPAESSTWHWMNGVCKFIGAGEEGLKNFYGLTPVSKEVII